MIGAYVIIYIYVKISSKMLSASPSNNENNKKEYKILIQVHYSVSQIFSYFQSFLICGFLEIQNLAFKFLPYFGLDGQWKYVINFIQNDISILNNTINPIVLFLFNSDIRTWLKKIFKKKIKVHQISSTPRLSINVSSSVRRMS